VYTIGNKTASSFTEYYWGGAMAQHVNDIIAANPQYQWQWYDINNNPVGLTSGSRYYLKPWNPGQVINIPPGWPAKPIPPSNS